MKALALAVQKLLARLKFQRGGQNGRQNKNNMPPPHLRSRGHKNRLKLSSKTFTLLSNMLRVLRQVKTMLNFQHMLINVLRVKNFYATF